MSSLKNSNLIFLNVIIYHKDCLDGLAAAYVANYALGKENNNSNAINIPVGHVNKDDKLEFIHNNINLKIKEKVDEIKTCYNLASQVSVAIYVVDHSFNKTECQYICGFISRECEANSHITILDHHVSAFDDWSEAQSQENILKKVVLNLKLVNLIIIFSLFQNQNLNNKFLSILIIIIPVHFYLMFILCT